MICQSGYFLFVYIIEFESSQYKNKTKKLCLKSYVPLKICEKTPSFLWIASLLAFDFPNGEGTVSSNKEVIKFAKKAS